MVKVVAPARSLAIVSPDVTAIADRRFAELGLTVTFGDHVDVIDEFDSSPIADRVADLHAAFADPSVKAIITVLGGYNSNQLLPFLDWELISANPKIVCGYSDITALTCAIHAHTGLVTYSGPHYSTFGMLEHFEQTFEWFRRIMFDDSPLHAVPSSTWSDDGWYSDQGARTLVPSDGPWVVREGTARGLLVGGNLCTLNLLQGTPHMPPLAGRLVFLEDDFLSFPANFAGQFASLTQQPGFHDVAGLLIGRFQTASGMTRDLLERIVTSNPQLGQIPIVANLDFGHTDPLLTIPVGGHATIDARSGEIPKLVIG
jgi:muramoyltetrapeptide carboxypeptidase LdcA involved in peptidoglycan recycling